MPLYNAERFLEETIQSVLNQTYQNFELIIIDDCGQDGSLNIAEKYAKLDKRIKIYSNKENKGIAYSRNRGLQEARGEYIALLDDDDIAMPNRLELQVKYLDEHLEIGAVGGNAQWIDENNIIIRETIDIVSDPDTIRMFFLFRNIFNNSEMTFRKSIVEKNDIKYHDGYYGMEDFHFWINFLHFSKTTMLPDLLLKKRVFAHNETNKNKNNKAVLRAQKFFELQKLSLTLAGFTIDLNGEYVLKKYLSENDYFCKNMPELEELKSFLLNILMQAQKIDSSIYKNMQSWFSGLLMTHYENVGKLFFMKWQSDADLLVSPFEDKQKWIEDLISGNRGLISQNNFLILENKKLYEEIKFRNYIFQTYKRDYRSIYIYGAGTLGMAMNNILTDMRIEFDGFVVSAENGSVEFNNHTIITYQELLLKDKDYIVIVALNKKNSSEVIPRLEKDNINYIYPFNWL